MRYSGKDPNQDAEIKSAMFCCIPYFSLGQYNSSNFTRESFVHPIRTLLQSRYRLEATEKRDKQQVIRKLGRPEHDGILHVPQLWCLAINKSKHLNFYRHILLLKHLDPLQRYHHYMCTDGFYWSSRDFYSNYTLYQISNDRGTLMRAFYRPRWATVLPAPRTMQNVVCKSVLSI